MSRPRRGIDGLARRLEVNKRQQGEDHRGQAAWPEPAHQRNRVRRSRRPISAIATGTMRTTVRLETA